jgi:ATP-dependent exoDNAse (exonuclease V) alpha subunit
MLYVALTRATQRLSVVHAEPLPEPLVAQSAEQTFTSA